VRGALPAGLDPFLEQLQLRPILLPSDWWADQCRRFLLKDLALLGPPSTGTRTRPAPRESNWDVGPAPWEGGREVELLVSDVGCWDDEVTETVDDRATHHQSAGAHGGAGPQSEAMDVGTPVPPPPQTAGPAGWCEDMITPALGACLLADPSAPRDSLVSKDQLLAGLGRLGVTNKHEAYRTLTYGLEAYGLEWRAFRLDLSPPGRRLPAPASWDTLVNTAMARGQKSSDKFTISQEEWQALGIAGLCLDHYIISHEHQRLYRPLAPIPHTLQTVISSVVQDLERPSRIPGDPPTKGSWAQLLNGAPDEEISFEKLARVFTQTLAIPLNEIANGISTEPLRRSDLLRIRKQPPHICTSECPGRLGRLPLSGLARASSKKRGRAASTTAPSAAIPDPDAALESLAHQVWDTFLGNQAFQGYIARLLVLAAAEPELTEIYLNWVWSTSVRCILTRLGMPDNTDAGPKPTVTYALASLYGPRSQLSQTALILQPTSTVYEVMLQVCPEATGRGLMVAIGQQSKLRLEDDPLLRVHRPASAGASAAALPYCQLPPDCIFQACFQPGPLLSVEIWPALQLHFESATERTILDATGAHLVARIGSHCPVGSLKLQASDSDSLPRLAAQASQRVLRTTDAIIHDLTPVNEAPPQIDLTEEGAGSLIHFLLCLPTSTERRRVSGNPQDSLATVLAQAWSAFSQAHHVVTCNELPVPPNAPLHRTIAPGSVVRVHLALQASALAQSVRSPPRRDHLGPPTKASPPASTSSIEILYNRPGKACPQSAWLPASLPLKAAAQRLFGFPTADLPGHFYLRVNNTYPRTSSELDTPLSQWRWAENHCFITLIGRLLGGMPGGEEDMAGPASPGGTDLPVEANQLASMEHFCEQLVARAKLLRLDKDFLAGRVDTLDDSYQAFSMEQREAMLRPRDAAPRVDLTLPEILLQFQRQMPETWTALALGPTDTQSLEPACALARQHLTRSWVSALKAPALHFNRVTRLTHTGRGAPIESILADDVDSITMISAFRDRQEALTYLASLGLRIPMQLERRHRHIVLTSFRPHIATATNRIPNGLATFSIRRTADSMKALGAIYRGEQLVAPGLNPAGPGMIFVSRRIESLSADRWVRTPHMCLEPTSPQEGLKYEMVIRLLTTLGLPLDLFATAMVNMLFQAGYLGAAEILPENDYCFATVFSLRGTRRPGRLQVRFCQPAPPKEDRAVITFNFSDFMCRLMQLTAEDLPGLLQQLSFKLALHKKDKLTAREREASASLVMDLRVRNPADFLLERHRAHGNKTETEAEGFPVPLLEEWLCEHVIGFLRRHLSVAHSSLITSDTVGVELTHDRTGRIGRASQLLIHFTAPPGADYLAFTPQVAATLAFQLGFLVGCRGDNTGPYAQLQWCPILSLLDNYPSVMWGECQNRCALVRVSFSLHLGPTSEADDSKPWWKLDNRATEFTGYDISRDSFLQQLERSLLKHPERVTPTGLVLLAQSVDQRGPGLGDERRKQRERDEQRIIAQNPATSTTDCIMVHTPAIIAAEERVGIRTLQPLCPPELTRLMWAANDEFGSPARLARAHQCAALRFHSSWIGSPLSDFFDAGKLCEMAPELQGLFFPAESAVPPVQASISPFCLHCRSSIRTGVYDQSKYVSHCTECLPLLVGVAAAARAIRLLLDIFDNALGPQASADPGGPKSKALYRSSEESRSACKAIMDLGPHPLPWLIHSAYPHTAGYKAQPGPNTLCSYVEDFTARACLLAQRIQKEPQGPVAADATIAHWALMESLRLDARQLASLLRRWAPAAAERSDRNVLHHSTLPSHLLPPSRKRDGDAGPDTQPQRLGNGRGRPPSTCMTEEPVDISAHTVDRRPVASLPPSGHHGGGDDDMTGITPSGRPPDGDRPPAHPAPAASP